MLWLRDRASGNAFPATPTGKIMSVPLPFRVVPPAFPQPKVRRKTSCVRRIFCGSLCFVALTGCTTSLPSERCGILTSRGVTVCREYRPPFGGQTIRPPRRMADVTRSGCRSPEKKTPGLRRAAILPPKASPPRLRFPPGSLRQSGMSCRNISTALPSARKA